MLRNLHNLFMGNVFKHVFKQLRKSGKQTLTLASSCSSLLSVSRTMH